MDTEKKKYKVLLVEDDEIIAKTIQFYLKQCEIYTVFHASNAGEALGLMKHSPDIILMDIMLPDVSGIDLCSKLREYTYCPIIFISAIDDDDTIVKALNTGGDDYLVKPFNNKVLNARILSNLRRTSHSNEKEKDTKLEYKDFTIDAISHRIVRNDKSYSLAPIEFLILMTLVKNSNKVISGEEIYQEVWNRESFGDLRTVTVHICNLRRKIGDTEDRPRYIKTIRGSGYLFDPEGK